MEIKRASANVQNDKRMMYKLTKSPDVHKLKDAIDETLCVKGFCYYDDSKDGENEKIILTIIDDTGTVYGTNSKTAMSNFTDMLEFFETDIEVSGMTIAVKSSVSKSGREFIMLDFAG